MRKIVAALALTFLAGCTAGRDVPSAEAGIAAFHHQLDAQAFDAIYAGSAPDMKTGTSQASFVQLLSAIHRKLGSFQSGSAAGWNDNVTTSGHFVTVTYAAKYAGGAADETFVYRLDGDHAVLAGYHVNSTALIVN